jgi:chromosome segregation ATPase
MSLETTMANMEVAQLNERVEILSQRKSALEQENIKFTREIDRLQNENKNLRNDLEKNGRDRVLKGARDSLVSLVNENKKLQEVNLSLCEEIENSRNRLRSTLDDLQTAMLERDNIKKDFKAILDLIYRHFVKV